MEMIYFKIKKIKKGNNSKELFYTTDFTGHILGEVHCFK